MPKPSATSSKILSILLFTSYSLISGCSESDRTPTQAERASINTTPVTAISTPAAQPTSNSASDPDVFSYENTDSSYFEGEWKVDSISTKKTDASVLFFKNLVDTQYSIFLKFKKIKPWSSKAQIEIQTPAGSTSTPCKATIDLDGAFCCINMLRVTLVSAQTPPSAIESSPGCIKAHYNIDPALFAAQIVSALLESPTNSQAHIYHFTHNQKKNRIRLQSPPPATKKDPIPGGVETEIFMTQVGN